MTDSARIQRIAAAVRACAESWLHEARLIGDVTAAEIRELAIFASQAVAPPEPVAVTWYPYPHEPNRHHALHDGQLEVEVYQTQAIAPHWYWDVSLGSGSFSITGGVADTIDAAKAAAIAAARAWRDSIRL